MNVWRTFHFKVMETSLHAKMFIVWGERFGKVMGWQNYWLGWDDEPANTKKISDCQPIRAPCNLRSHQHSHVTSRFLGYFKQVVGWPKVLAHFRQLQWAQEFIIQMLYTCKTHSQAFTADSPNWMPTHRPIEIGSNHKIELDSTALCWANEH